MKLKNIAKKAVSALLILSFTASCTAYAASHEGFILSGAGSWISGNIDSDNNCTVTELKDVSNGGVQIPSSFTYYNDTTESYATCNVKHLDISTGYYESAMKKYIESGGNNSCVFNDPHNSVLLLPDSLESVRIHNHYKPGGPYGGKPTMHFKYVVLKGTNCKNFEYDDYDTDCCVNVITSPGSDVYKDCIIQDIPVATGRTPQLNRTSITVTVGSYFPVQMLNTSNPSIKFSCNNHNLEYTDMAKLDILLLSDSNLNWKELSTKYVTRGIYAQAIKVGTSTITATYNGKEYNCVVNVLPLSDDNCKQCIKDYYQFDNLSSDFKHRLGKNLLNRTDAFYTDYYFDSDDEYYRSNFDTVTRACFNYMNSESIVKWLKSL